MIPKIIHYCWYGKGKKDELTERCIDSWKTYCPNYQIIEWNEENCDIDSSIFASEAYSSRKWAFVADWFRLKKLYEYGGVYLDTDVELIKNIDTFLDNDSFIGYADDIYLGSGLFGCNAKNEFCKALLDYYEQRHFINEDGSFYDVPNNQIYTAISMRKLGFCLGDRHIECGNTEVYPSDFFSPFKKRTIGEPSMIYRYENFDCTSNTYAIHYTVYSWEVYRHSLASKIKLIVKQTVRSILPRRLYIRLKKEVKLKEINKRVIF